MRSGHVRRFAISVAVVFLTLPSITIAADGENVFTDLKKDESDKDALDTINSFLKRGDEVRRCSLIVEAHPGRLEDVYAGICKQKSGRTVLACGDTGIGESGIKPTDSFDVSPATRKALLDFARLNCPAD